MIGSRYKKVEVTAFRQAFEILGCYPDMSRGRDNRGFFEDDLARHSGGHRGKKSIL